MAVVDMKAGDLVDGRYLLEAMLGRGGMGVVWRALDGRLERRVALKMLHPATAPTDPAMHARFAREARLLATLDHPAVVSIYDYSAEHDPPFLVMQLIDGHTLEAEVADAPLDRRRLRKLLAPVAEALTYAHGRGIVHRDLKPANVLLDRDGRVRVTDFGLARLAFGETSITVGTQLIGSPEYWAPEQAAGRDTSTAADLYALGVILFLLASGELPFPAGQDRIQAGFRRIHEDAPSLATAAPGLSRRDPDLVALCDALLARDPAARPTAAETAERLRREEVVVVPARRTDAPTVVVSAADAPTPAAPTPAAPTPAAAPVPPAAAWDAASVWEPVPSEEAEPRRTGYVPTALTPAPAKGGGRNGRRAAVLALLGLTLAAGTAVAFTALDEGDEGDAARTSAATTGAATADGAAASAETGGSGGATSEGTPTGPAATTDGPAATTDAPAATTEAPTSSAATTEAAPTPPPTTAPADTAEAGGGTPTDEEDEAEDEGDVDGGAALAAALPGTFRSESCRFRHPEEWSTRASDARRGSSHIDNAVRDRTGTVEVVCARDQQPTTAASIANRVRQLYVGDRGYVEESFGPARVAGRDAYLWEYRYGGSTFKEAFFAPGVGLRVQAPTSDWARQEPLADRILASYDGP